MTCVKLRTSSQQKGKLSSPLNASHACRIGAPNTPHHGIDQQMLCVLIASSHHCGNRSANSTAKRLSAGAHFWIGIVHFRAIFREGKQRDHTAPVGSPGMEHVVRDRLGIYRGSHGAHIENVVRTSFGTYNLIYQLGEGLTADLPKDTSRQEVTFAFSKGPVHYSDFRQA
jgi:hypothetical protein